MYKPQILLCGDREKFSYKMRDHQFEIIGQISFKGSKERGEFKMFANLDVLENLTLKPEDFQIFLNGEEISLETLRKILDGTADYIVFDNDEIIERFNELYQLGLQGKFITTESLLKYAPFNFYSLTNSEILIKKFKTLNISRLLDVDNFIARNDLFYIWIDPDLEIETVDRDSFAKKYLIVENLYSKIYSSLGECRLQNYDALLLTAERDPAEFLDLLIETDGMSENILIFVRKNSALSFWLNEYSNAFKKIEKTPAINGEWISLKKFMPPEDFCMYVVTHKDVKLDILPEGYKIIHAGHALAKEEFGYLGDDSGDNISNLNRYLNEITALYWIWKNTKHTVIGLCHYRRFFTKDNKNFLTTEESRELLCDCDMIVVKGHFFLLTQTELKTIICDDTLNKYVEKIFRKYISLKQPDYLEAFDYVSSSYSEFLYEMFITRRNIFNAYCEWLFSFIIDVTAEVIATTNIEENNNPRKYRSIGLVSERLMTVWLMKNRLRIKALPIIFRRNI